MSPKDRQLAKRFRKQLIVFHEESTPIPAVESGPARDVLVRQLVDSVKRVKFVHKVRERQVSEKRADPSDASMFDPIRAAIWYHQNDEHDEACWLVFLATHFGKHKEGGWRYARQVYNRKGQAGVWGWQSVSSDPMAFRDWLRENYDRIKNSPEPGGFGNHRKYESLNVNSQKGTDVVVESYVDWICSDGTHKAKFDGAIASTSNECEAFDLLYRSMTAVARFGRLGKFDYLTMISKVGLAEISPGSTYMTGATGPLKGARLLLGDGDKKLTPKEMDQILIRLGEHLDVGMQVIEDALCNWEKNPMKYVNFSG